MKDEVRVVGGGRDENMSEDEKVLERVSFWDVVSCHLFYVSVFCAFARIVLDFDSVADMTRNRISAMPLLIPTIWFVIVITVNVVRDCRNRHQKGYWVRSKHAPKSWFWAIAWLAALWFLLPLLMNKLENTNKETIDGVTWRYKIVDGNAVIGRKRPQWCSAISVSTVGDLAIPSSLGGRPVTGIGEYAFFKCSKLTTVTIPSSVTNIETGAFEGCVGLTSIEIPESVTTLGYAAFGRCSSLKTVKLRGTASHAWGAPFVSCRALAAFEVDPGNERCKVVDGMLLSKDGTRLLVGVNGDVVIPDGVRKIEYGAFAGRELKSVAMPGTVVDIKELAFENSHGLTSIELPESVTNIGFCAFRGCDGLTSVTIPNGVKSIGAWAFGGCRGLRSVVLPESVKFIGNDAFHGCNSLVSIVVPSNVAHIGPDAFAGTPFFENMPDGLIEFSGIAYKFKGVCPESVSIPNGVTRIYEGAFKDCLGLKSVAIPNSVTNIGRLAFCSCRSLTSLEIPEGVTAIESQAFWGCDGLLEVAIPRSLLRIDGYFWAHVKKVYVQKGDVERVKMLFRESDNRNIVDYAEFVERGETMPGEALPNVREGSVK